MLRELAILCELRGENAFRARAFEAAARAVEQHPVSVAALAREGRLQELPGIGRGVNDLIVEMVRTGTCALRDELLASLPPGLLELLTLPGLGPKRVRRIWQELGAATVEDLERACRDGRLLELPGFGKRIRDGILEGMEFRRQTRGRFLLSTALTAAEDTMVGLRESGAFSSVEPTGALRRGARTIEVVDLLVVLRDEAQPGAALGVVVNLDDGGDSPEKPEVNFPLRIRRSGVPVVVHATRRERAAVELARSTGVAAHWDRLRERARETGLELADDGLLRKGNRLPLETERALYDALDLAWVPPELREGDGEVVAARLRRLPGLVTRQDLRGLVHAHTTASDGLLSLEALALASAERGYEYLCVSDHSRSAAYAGGLSVERLRAQHQEARALDRSLRPFRVFHGVESDILADGSLDYGDEVLAELDFVIGSVHSGLVMSPEKATQRLIAAVRSPFLTILGHPSGSLLLEREGYRYDEDRLLAALREGGVVLEHNCNPSRLDPDWPLLKRAGEAGVLVALCPDAHDAAGLDDVAYGVVMARKAWLEPAHVMNCMRAEDLDEWLRDRKARHAP